MFCMYVLLCIYVTLSAESSLILGEKNAAFRREGHICYVCMLGMYVVYVC